MTYFKGTVYYCEANHRGNRIGISNKDTDLDFPETDTEVYVSSRDLMKDYEDLCNELMKGATLTTKQIKLIAETLELHRISK